MTTNNINLIKFNKQFAILPLELLETDDYQRPLSLATINKIVNKFDPRGIGTIQVSKRDNRYFVFDGNHRVHALKKLGERTVECIIYSGMTYKDEAKAFDYFNTTKKAGPLDLANSALEQEDPSALKIYEIVSSLGLEIDYHSTGDRRKIKAYKSIEWVLTKFGPDALRKTLSTILGVFGSQDNRAYTSDNIKGFAAFIDKYKDHERYKENILLKHLSLMTPLEFKAEVYKKKMAWNLKAGDAVVATLLDIHNSHRNYENRI